MNLVHRQLVKECFKNKMFLCLMFLSTTFTSFLYYFVHFSTDGNLPKLASLASLTKQQTLFHVALASNTILARNGLITLTALSALLFSLFFYRFLKTNRRQYGCFKALGFHDARLSGFLVTFTGVFPLLGAPLGGLFAYFASDLLIESYMQSYLVTGLVKELSAVSALIGCLVPVIALCLAAFLAYAFSIRGKEAGLLIADTSQQSKQSLALRFADRIAMLAPKQYRLSVRLAFRKPLALLLVVLSVTSCSVMFILGYSLTLSSQSVLQSQILGHAYRFDTQFEEPQYAPIPAKDATTYLTEEGTIAKNDVSIQRTFAGLDGHTDLFTLLDKQSAVLPFPTQGEVVIGSDLQDLYGFQPGDRISLTINGQTHHLTVSGVAWNATANWVYLSKSELTSLLSLPTNAYTGILSMDQGFEGGTCVTQEQKLAVLDRATVSNRSSALINQAIGCMVGCMLLYLALLLNFGDSTRDLLILHLMGYQAKEIRRMLIDIYRPMVCLSFLVTLWPAMLITKSILRSLSIQIGEYLPFETNLVVIIGIFALQLLLYLLVQGSFRLNIANILKKDGVSEVTNTRY